ncbi:MAG: elongation factor Ts [Patescibacteria group bacterium]|nr:elongation factor Ts [Patescibacteria group bacterium]
MAKKPVVNVSLDDVKKLRSITGVGIGLCREALGFSKGDFDEAVKYIRKKGAAKAVKRAGREALEGVLGVYIHGVDQKIAAVVELNCETDFVARNEDFKKLAHELAMQVAAMKAEYVDMESVPAEVIKAEKEIIMESDELKTKPENVRVNITKGKLQKFYKEHCLLEQDYFRAPSIQISDLINDTVAKIGEKIVVRRIYRMCVGE